MTTMDRRTYLKLMGGALAADALLPRSQSLTWAQVVGTSSDQVGLFLGLSAVLTGVPSGELDVDLALEYIDRLESKAPGVLGPLLAKFAKLQEEAKGDPRRLVELVEREIWKPHCPTISIGGSEVCDLAADPECCIARDIPLLWYTSALMEVTNLEVPATQFVYGSAAAYLGALAWKVGEGHPQGQCGGTYGYWSTKPGTTHKTSG